jgi:hypothetical protein
MKPSVAGAPGRPPQAVVGPAPGGRLGRWKVSVPLAVTAVALCSAAPVMISVLLVLVGMPVLATLGDYRVHLERQRAGQAARWLERRDARAAAPVLVAKNLLLSIYRSVLPLAFLGAMVAIWYLIDKTKASTQVGELWLRGTGAATALIMVKIAARPGRIRTSEGVDELLSRVTGPTGRMIEAGWILWIVCVGLTAAGLWFTPDLFPLNP